MRASPIDLIFQLDHEVFVLGAGLGGALASRNGKVGRCQEGIYCFESATSNVPNYLIVMGLHQKFTAWRIFEKHLHELIPIAHTQLVIDQNQHVFDSLVRSA